MGGRETLAPLTLSPFPLSFPLDRLELEAAQKFLERAAVENLVRAIPLTPIPPSPYPLRAGLPALPEAQASGTHPAPSRPLPPTRSNLTPPSGSRWVCPAPGPGSWPMTRRAGVTAAQSSRGLRAAVQREGERGRERKLGCTALRVQQGWGWGSRA